MRIGNGDRSEMGPKKARRATGVSGEQNVPSSDRPDAGPEGLLAGDRRAFGKSIRPIVIEV